jgi:hypothetical protein
LNVGGKEKNKTLFAQMQRKKKVEKSKKRKKLVLTNVGNVPHDNVDKSVLHEGEEHEHRAPGHEHVDGLDNVHK